MGHVLLIIILMCLSIIASPSSGAKSQKNVWSPKKFGLPQINHYFTKKLDFNMLEKMIRFHSIVCKNNYHAIRNTY